MEDIVFKTEALIPIWVRNSGISALDKMAERPVLIGVKSLGKVMHGQMLQMTMSGATILPDDSFLIWKSVHVKVSFRFADIVYHLSGMTMLSEPDLSFRFEFDGVTRKSVVILGKKLGDAGLLDAADAEQMYAAKDALANEPEDGSAAKAKKGPLTARLVRHEQPPGGRERRVDHRYDIDANAKLAVINSSFNLECLVLELSLGGCRVYTGSPNNVEHDTQVEVQFVERGYPLRLPARIQVKSGPHILGLRFSEMSERMKERLKNLICEVAEREKGISS